MTYFCLDKVAYHGTGLTILYDQNGERYRKGKGLRVFAGGEEIASAPGLQRLTAKLPETAGGWRKYDGDPIIGGQYGTVFDIAVLREGGRYRMWGSWRPRKSLALFESGDGIHWSAPEIVFGPNPATNWEEDINRPAVVKRADGYHLWYPGQANGRSWIGYATSADGKGSSTPAIRSSAPEKNRCSISTGLRVARWFTTTAGITCSTSAIAISITPRLASHVPATVLQIGSVIPIIPSSALGKIHGITMPVITLRDL